jgi:hypothetical protein
LLGLWLSWVVVVSGSDGGGGGCHLLVGWGVIVVVDDGEEGLRVGCICLHGLFSTRDTGIVYFLNNAITMCLVSSAGWRVIIQGLKGVEFNSRYEHLFLYKIQFYFN